MLWSLLALICFASAKFNAWYLLTLLPLATLLPPHGKTARLMYYLSLAQLLAFTPLENVHILNALLLTGVPVWLSHRSTPVQQSLKLL
jgi:hypothetical protein